MGDLHAYPLNDLREHDTESKDCPCNPVIEVNGASLLVIHKAWDCREAVEMAKEILYCKPKSKQGAFMRASGIIPWKEGDELPEDTIRRLRGHKPEGERKDDG